MDLFRNIIPLCIISLIKNSFYLAEEQKHVTEYQLLVFSLRETTKIRFELTTRLELLLYVHTTKQHPCNIV